MARAAAQVESVCAREKTPGPAGCPVARALVYVDHGAASVARHRDALGSAASRHGALLITVDTSQDLRTRGGAPVNEAFEFSGYQYGLEQAVVEARSAGATSMQVALINGTVLTAHIRPMLSACLSRAFAGEVEGPSARGFRHAVRPPVTSVARFGYYLATFAFSLRGPLDALEHLTVYDRTRVGQGPLGDAYRQAGAEYAAHVDRWLHPTSLLRGWYQAIPGQPLDAGTLYRKRLAILFEHAMPGWLAAQGFEIEEPSARDRALMRVLMTLDKTFVNALKLRHRLLRAVRAR